MSSSSSTDSAEEFTPRKRSKLRAFSSTEKSVIYNIYTSIMESAPKALISEIVKQTASTSGVGEASVYRIIREKKSTKRFSSPKKNKPRKTILDKMVDFDKNAIRRIVHQFFFRNEIPTINKVLVAVNDDESLPNFKRSTFHKLLKSLDFKYVRRGRNSVLLKPDETCKLCFKFVQGDGMFTLDNKILEKLEFLQMDLDKCVEESNSLCKECNEKIGNAFSYKSYLVNSVKSSEDKQQNITSTSTVETSAEKTLCHLCKNNVNKISVISLTKLLKDDGMMEVFQRHIQEIDLKSLDENSMVCEWCQKSLANFSTIVSSWSIANDWNEDVTKDDDFEMVEVKEEKLNGGEISDWNTNSSYALKVSGSNSAKVSVSKKGKGERGHSSSVNEGTSGKKIKTEIVEIFDSSESVSLSNKDVKKEKPEDNEEVEELQLKNEEIDIKDEGGQVRNF